MYPATFFKLHFWKKIICRFYHFWVLKSDFCELYGFSKICLLSSEKEQKIKREENEKKKMRKRGVEGGGTSTGWKLLWQPGEYLPGVGSFFATAVYYFGFLRAGEGPKNRKENHGFHFFFVCNAAKQEIIKKVCPKLAIERIWK